MLAQYSQSQSVDIAYTNKNGDPFMIILPPVDQKVNDVPFVAYETQNIVKYFINIISPSKQVNNIFLDGVNIGNQFFIYKNGLYSYAQVPIEVGPHRILNNDPKGGFLATVYGFGGVEAFGYGVGYNLDINVDLGSDTIINQRKTRIICASGDSLVLDAGSFEKYLWSSGDTLQTIKVKNQSIYSVIASVGECEKKDTVNVIINNPVISLGNDTVVCNPDIIHLDAGWKTYNWSTGEQTQIINPKTAATYSIEVSNRLNCKAFGKVKVSFDDRPKLLLSQLDTLFCGQKSGILNIGADKGSFTLERTDDHEIAPNLKVSVPAYGTFPYKFTATDLLGCVSDTSFKVGFHKTPKVSFSIDSTKCYSYNLIANYLGDAIVDASRFTWVFGGDTIADGIGIISDTIPLGTNQNKRDLSLRVLEEGCASADTIKNIKVIPNLELQVKDILGCQPFRTEFTAMNSEKVFYDWDYGDGIAERSDNHPVHVYQKDGYYNLKLKVTTEKDGCTNSVFMDSLIYVAPIPTVGFSLDPLLCLNDSVNEIAYAGTGDPLDTYHWDLTSFDTEEIIKDPGNTQGPFLFDLRNKPKAGLTLQVVSKYGCTSSIGRTEVKRKPSFDFSALGNKGCMPLLTTFSTSQKDPVDQINYNWDFGDGKTATGSETSHLYSEKDKYYTVILKGSSGTTGCDNTALKDTLIHIYPKPVAAFTLDQSIVYTDKPAVQFANQSQGATHFFWAFGDGSTSAEKDPLNNFKGHGSKKVFMKAINDYECSDTISHDVLVAFNRIFPPNAFSPNAPNEIDRAFILKQEAVREEGYHLVIMSRWNDIVFETRNEIKGWDGKIKNREYAPAGNYVWIVEFTDFLNRTHRQTGTVTLLY